MSLTLLLDLDDTLLDSSVATFIPAYFKKLAGFLAPRVDPEKLIRELLAGTDRMLKNECPSLTLEEVFSDYFYPALGVERAELQPEIERFYEQAYPALKEFTAPRPAAVELVEAALEKGWRVVVATNPLFPLTAIEQRLRWANLPPEKYPFAWITSMETSHFTKMVPAYYAEILGHLGWPAGPVLMAGDDAVMDVKSSTQAGLPAFWLRPDGHSLPDFADLPQASTLEAFATWLDGTDLEQLQPDLKTPVALLQSLQSTPAVLDTLIRTLKPAEWLAPPRPGEWTFTEIVCHLRDFDLEVNLPRVQALIAEDNAFIAAQDTDPWAAERQYIRQDGPVAFRDFVSARMRLVGTLRGLSAEGWKRRARHTIFGPTGLQELVDFMAEHDRTHIRQIRALLEAVRQSA